MRFKLHVKVNGHCWRMLLIAFAFMISFEASSQGMIVKGQVISEEGEPIPGVTVTIKNSTRGTVTSVEGTYSVEISDENQILVFSFIGYRTQEITVGSQSIIDVQLVNDTQDLEEFVVIGYGSVRKKDLTGSVGTVNVEDISKAPVSSFTEALAGRVAGVRVSGNDGQPGGGMDIMIRGVGSLTNSTSPLFVIDGFPIEDFNAASLNPEDIKSMTVLKDASAAAVYGSRAANGVIIIETKRGIVGKPVVSFSSSYGTQKITNKMEMMSVYDYVKYQTELDPNAPYTLAYFEDDRTLENYRNVEGISWQDEVTRTGVVKINNISVRGGSEDTRYAISGSFYDQEGIVLNTGMDRYTARVTLDQRISDKIKSGITVNYSGITTNGQNLSSNPGSNQSSSVLFRTWAYRPVSPDPNVDLLNDFMDEVAFNASDHRINPVIDLENQHQINNTKVLEANGFLTYDITDDLELRIGGGIRNSDRMNERFYNSRTSQGNPLNPLNADGVYGSVHYLNNLGLSNENTLTYSKTFNDDHSITAMGLVGFNSYEFSEHGYTGRHLPNEELGIHGIEEGNTIRPVASSSINTMVSYAGRLDYNYKSKYMITGTFRADGSSKFLDPWGYFPGVAVAWNMAEENFFSDALPFVSTSKIRASYGSVGNNRVSDFAAHPRLSSSINGYSFNDQPPQGMTFVSPSGVGNPSLIWEKVTSVNIGYELGLFQDRVALELDLYRRKTENMLMSAPIPPSSGFLRAEKNIGELQNEGFEITLNTVNFSSGTRNRLSWSSQFNISFNRNEILYLTRGQEALENIAAFESQFNNPLYRSEVGNAAGMMYGYVWEGNYQFEDFNNPAPDVYVLKSAVPTNGASRNSIQPGDIKYRDLNGDGIINTDDKTFIGRGQPLHIGGFANNLSYKGFDLHVFFQWAYGHNIYNANRISLEGNANGRHNMNQFASYANRWTPENPTDENYRTRGQGPIGYHASRVVEDGSFLRLKTVSLSYTLPTGITDQLRYFRNISLNISSQNLITWTNYSGLDPEVSTRGNILTPGFDYSAYPQARTLVLGIRAEL